MAQKGNRLFRAVNARSRQRIPPAVARERRCQTARCLVQPRWPVQPSPAGPEATGRPCARTPQAPESLSPCGCKAAGKAAASPPSAPPPTAYDTAAATAYPAHDSIAPTARQTERRNPESIRTADTLRAPPIVTPPPGTAVLIHPPTPAAGRTSARASWTRTVTAGPFICLRCPATRRFRPVPSACPSADGHH